MKYSLLFCCLPLLPILSPAQSRPPIRFGVSGGGTLTTIVGAGTSGLPKEHPLVGLAGGLLAQVPLTPKGQVVGQTELFFHQQGHRLSNPESNYRARLRSTYLSLPLLVGMTSHHFFFLAGPQLDYLVAVREHYQFGGYIPSYATPYPVSEVTETDAARYQRWHVSLTAAVGYRFQDRFGVEVRYGEALTSPSRSGYGYEPRNAEAQLRLTYLLP